MEKMNEETVVADPAAEGQQAGQEVRLPKRLDDIVGSIYTVVRKIKDGQPPERALELDEMLGYERGECSQAELNKDELFQDLLHRLGFAESAAEAQTARIDYKDSSAGDAQLRTWRSSIVPGLKMQERVGKHGSGGVSASVWYEQVQ